MKAEMKKIIGNPRWTKWLLKAPLNNILVSRHDYCKETFPFCYRAASAALLLFAATTDKPDCIKYLSQQRNFRSLCTSIVEAVTSFYWP